MKSDKYEVEAREGRMYGKERYVWLPGRAGDDLVRWAQVGGCASLVRGS